MHEPRILAAVACLQHDDRELAAILQPAHEAAADEIPLELRQRMFFLQLLPDDVRKREGRQLLRIAEEESPFRKTHAGKDFRASGHARFIKHDDVEQPFVRNARRQNRRPQNADVRSRVDFALHLFRLQDKAAEKVRIAGPAAFRNVAANGFLCGRMTKQRQIEETAADVVNSRVGRRRHENPQMLFGQFADDLLQNGRLSCSRRPLHEDDGVSHVQTGP